ncbi:MAG: DUF362 domain-containing protein [Zavarzinella sp.]
MDKNLPLDTIRKAELPTGGWGYIPGQQIHFEPTCFATLVLAAVGNEQERVHRAIAALDANSDGKGTYLLQRGRPAATWPTSLVLLTKAALHSSMEQLLPIINRLLFIRGQVIPADPEVASMMDIDPQKVGWPWALGTFSWAEPTAWAVFALRKAGYGQDLRVLEGIRLLLDRAFPDGGINYGNRQILGKMTEPIPGPTAMMLLALQGYQHPMVESALKYLIEATKGATDLEHLGWAKIALDCYREFDFIPQALNRIDEQLRQSYTQQTADGRPVSIPRHAITWLGLNCDRQNVFELTSLERQAYPLDNVTLPPAEKQPPPKMGLGQRIKSKFRGFMLNGLAALKQLPACSDVSIQRANDYSEDLTAKLVAQFGHFRQHLPLQGKRVVLKPNLVEFRKAQVINTHPNFVRAVIQMCKQEGAAEIIVAEGPGHWRNVEFLVEESGLGAVLREEKVRFVDLNHDEPVKVVNLGRTTGLEYLFLTKTIHTADVFISLPKLKTHHWAGATLSLKNLFGTLPGICYGWPKNELHWRGIANSIIDIALTQTPHMAIVDGIVGMEGDGPLAGEAKALGAMIMGLDLVAVDATCCRLMGLPPERLPSLALGAFKKLGRIKAEEIPIIGESIDSMKQNFAWPPKIEEHLLPGIS